MWHWKSCCGWRPARRGALRVWRLAPAVRGVPPNSTSCMRTASKGLSCRCWLSCTHVPATLLRLQCSSRAGVTRSFAPKCLFCRCSRATRQGYACTGDKTSQLHRHAPTASAVRPRSRRTRRYHHSSAPKGFSCRRRWCVALVHRLEAKGMHMSNDHDS